MWANDTLASRNKKNRQLQNGHFCQVSIALSVAETGSEFKTELLLIKKENVRLSRANQKCFSEKIKWIFMKLQMM